MIDLYTWSTPNGRRAPIMLEECGLAYTPHYLELAKHEHKTEAMKKINWDQRIPVIVDPDGPDGKPLAVSESCAILLYLAEKTGKLLPTSGAARVEAQQRRCALDKQRPEAPCEAGGGDARDSLRRRERVEAHGVCARVRVRNDARQRHGGVQADGPP